MDDPKGRILAEATDLYLAEGPEGLSMRKIASRMGLSATAIYRHFENKEELVGQILLAGVRTFAEYLFDSLRGEEPEARLALTMEAFLRFGIEQPKHYEVFFLRKQPEAALAVREEFEAQRRAAFRFLMDRVRECMDAGLLREDSVVEVALAMLGQCQGLVSMHILGKLDLDDEQFKTTYRAAFRRQLDGLKTPGDAAARSQTRAGGAK